jgi:uncharacterized protein with HEPN domain
MYRKSNAAFLWDMLDAAESVREFVRGRSLNQYMADPVLQAACERKLEILGEAARKLPDGFKHAHGNIPWQRIIAQRHFLAHEYGAVDHKVVWKFIQTELHEIIRMLRPLIPPFPKARVR